MAHSEDVRLKVIRARLKLNMSINQTAEVFDIGTNTVKRWIREYRAEGKTKPKKGKRGAKARPQGECSPTYSLMHHRWEPKKCQVTSIAHQR